MKRVIITVVLAYFLPFCYAQTNYYYANDERNYWLEDSTSVNIIVSDSEQYDMIVGRILEIFSDKTDTVSYVGDDDNIIIISEKLRTIPIERLTSTICNNFSDISFITYAKRVNRQRIWLRNEIYVRLKSDNFHSSYLIPFLSQFSNYTLQYDTSEHVYRIACNDETSLMQIANGLHDTLFVDYSTPDFYGECSLNTSDPIYNNQWALNNTGQENGSPGVDIKAEKAWAFLQHYNNNTGDSIRVAVIDNGVEDHEDLRNASGSSRVLPGFPELFGSGSPNQDKQWHGQACAGIIAASHNGLGVAGIAPNSLIVPIRVTRDIYNITFSYWRIKKAINAAWKSYNAQILSISWSKPESDLINQALDSALVYGRAGKGCIITVSSGNNGSQVQYPATRTGVIAVGAVDRCGNRAGKSNIVETCDSWPSDIYDDASAYGPKLSVVAPGTRVYTTDRMGDAGKTDSSYTLFSGTSAACPHVAGVAALILSVNPNLTHAQVKEIIEKTAQKVGGYDYTIDDTILHPNGKWNIQVGYGMVNAFKALAETKIYGTEYTILGPSSMQLCNEYIYTLSGNVPEGYEIVWEVNPQMAIVSGQGTSTLVVRPIYQATGNWVKVRICYEGETIRDYKKSPIISTGVGHQLVIPHDSTITQNAFWNIERSLANSAIVDSGTVLTITSTIHCTDSARLIVRPGGKLVVDGGTLTSACPGELWQGIEVVGDRTKFQMPQYQGTVELRNGATIENAHCGIRTGLGEDNWHTTGGIIKADSSFFINNRRAVEFLSYVDTTASGTLADNQSYFHNTVFTVDNNNLFAANSCEFIDHVTLWQVKGVKFRGCTFSNLTNGHSNRKHAIYAFDAGITLETYCSNEGNGQPSANPGCECPEEYSAYNSFYGFNTAVKTGTSGEQFPILIDRAMFGNNDTAIDIGANQYATVIRCQFDLQQSPNPAANCGLYLNTCTGYKVEGNRFHKAVKFATPTSTGIRVNNSGSASNKIYKNLFDTLDYGIVVTQNNSGLQLGCDTFTFGGYDIYILPNGSIASNQGSLQQGADNKFVNTQISSLYNAAQMKLKYYHSPLQCHIPRSPYNASVYGTAAACDCPSTLCNGGIPGPGPVTSFASQVSAYTAAAGNANTDGGTVETQNLVSLQTIHQSLSDTYHAAVRAIMSDTVLDLNELEMWHTAAQPIGDPYSLTETRFMEGYAEIFAENAETANYAEFHALKLSLRGDNNDNAENNDNVDNQDNNDLQNSPKINWYALTPAQIAQLQTIAERNTGRASVMAKGVLCFFHGICYEDDLLGDDNMDNHDNNMETRSAKVSQQDGETNLTVYPNPTDDVLFIELRSDAEIANVALYDLQGRIVTGVFDTPQRGGTATINVKSIPAGVYVLRVTDGDGKEYQQKIVRK